MVYLKYNNISSVLYESTFLCTNRFCDLVFIISKETHIDITLKNIHFNTQIISILKIIDSTI